MRRVIVAAVGALTALVVAAAAVAGPGGPSLSPAGGSHFPQRSFALTLPQRVHLSPGQLRMTENGAPVHGLRAQPLAAARRSKFGVVLAIDASSSMRGRPLASAIAAARAFAHERSANQPLSLVTFNSSSKVAQPFTTDPFEIRSTLSRTPAAGGGTHIYDAARSGVDLIRRARLPGGFVVVLSDGTDRGSSVSRSRLAVAARAAHVRIYTVGLRSRHFDPTALRRLASEAGGSYSEASSAGQLHGIYSALGSQLSNAYLVTYRSLEGPHRTVEVTARIAGVGAATASYTTPRLEPGHVAPVAHTSAWNSPLVTVALAIVVAGLLGLGLASMLMHLRQTPRERVVQFVGDAPEEGERATPGRLVSRTEQSLSRAGWWSAFVQELEVAEVSWPAGKVVLATLSAAVGIGALLAAATGGLLVGLVAAFISPLLVRALVRTRASRRRRAFADQLADHLAATVSAMRAGHGLSGGLAAVLDEAAEPTRTEFQRVLNDERLGAPLEETLEEVGRRMNSREMEQVAMLAVLQREAGADAAEMLEAVVATIRERQGLKRTVRSLTAQGRLSRWILTALPVVVLIALTSMNPDYVDPLYHSSAGHALLALAAALVIAGSLVIERIVRFEI